MNNLLGNISKLTETKYYTHSLRYIQCSDMVYLVPTWSLSLAQSHIQSNLYIEPIFTGSNSEEETLEFYSQARFILWAVKFNLRAWVSNGRQLVHTEQREGSTDRNTLTTILGLHWNTSHDKLSLTLNGLDHPITPLTSNREVLQDSSKLFDPLSILNTISVCAELLMQQLWQQSVMLDEPLDQDILKEWPAILADICKSSVILINRTFSKHCINHLISATCICRCQHKGIWCCSLSIQLSFVMAKGGVALLKQIILPKLETDGCCHHSIASSTCYWISLFEGFHTWTDSQTVSSWIHSAKVLPSFVKHQM